MTRACSGWATASPGPLTLSSEDTGHTKLLVLIADGPRTQDPGLTGQSWPQASQVSHGPRPHRPVMAPGLTGQSWPQASQASHGSPLGPHPGSSAGFHSHALRSPVAAQAGHSVRPLPLHVAQPTIGLPSIGPPSCGAGRAGGQVASGVVGEWVACCLAGVWG
jgi:hypothetical protein